MRGKASAEVSAAVVDYVSKHKGLNDEQLAEELEVSLGFMNHLKALERSLTVDQLVVLERLAGMPLGKLALMVCGCASIAFTAGRWLPIYGAFLIVVTVITVFLFLQDKVVVWRNR